MLGSSQRIKTPPAFRDLLLSIARSATRETPPATQESDKGSKAC
jgi:hypothetical protein